MSKGIYIFATYWNEIDWIETSLEQIKLMSPEKVFICDGCYDRSKPVHSTDGTYERIKEFAKKNKNVEVINPIRQNRFLHFGDWIKQKNKTGKFRLHGRLFNLYLILKSDEYRLNQARTFNYMLEMSGIQEGDWFTTYDCDQFYSDSVIEYINNLSNVDGDIIVGKEYTFFDSFEQYTSSYERRDYNNMPHKYYSDMFFIPTRQPVRIIKGKYVIASNSTNKKIDGGIIYHYKIKSKERAELTYQVGDRKPPEKDRTITTLYGGKHPFLIVKNMSKLVERLKIN